MFEKVDKQYKVRFVHKGRLLKMMTTLIRDDEAREDSVVRARRESEIFTW